MGGYYYPTWPEFNKKPITPQSKGSQVIAFHSSTKWKLHFDSLKDTNKLDVALEYEVQAMPTFALMKRGKVVDKIVGADKDGLKMKIEKYKATWCGPCKYMEPVLNDFAAKYTDVEFVKIDVDELDDVAQEYGVQAMPTFVLIKKGKVVDKIVGADKDGLQKKIQKHKAIYV
ncbi:hypothetical protein RDI58_012703 [Solanum bulbocastanum]|uniref:Thioredoxin domain-containing protein n=1 Tax=Solanum bulbocastanum TaxID=147425 RepID=A0AAN8YDB2_SOLBU